MPGARDDGSAYEAHKGDRPILERAEEQMSQQTIDRPSAGKIQNVKKVVPPWIEIHRMDIGIQVWRGKSEVLLGRPHLKIAVAEGGEVSLQTHFSPLWGGKCLPQCNIDVERAQRKHFESPLLPCRSHREELGEGSRQQHRETDHTHA